MNKKNVFLAGLIIILGTSSVVPMQELTAQDEVQMLEHVRVLAKNNLITLAQFPDSNTIDQYIAILDKDSKAIMEQKNWNDGCLSRIGVGLSGLFASVNGMISMGLGAIAGIGTYRAKNLWDSYNLSQIVDPRSYGTMVKDVYKEALNDPSHLKNIINKPTKENQEKAIVYYSKSGKMLNIFLGEGNEAIARRNCATMAVGLVMPVVGVVGTAFACASILGYINVYQKNAVLAANSIKMQEQYDNNQLIIAQLRQLKYDAGL
jgi:hypothetical protein